MQAAIKHYTLTTNQWIIFFPRRTRINTDFYSVYSVDYLFSTEDTEGHGGESTITKKKTITFNGGRVVSASCLSP